MVTHPISDLREGTEKGEFVGTELFQEKSARMTKLRVKKLAHGDHRKYEIYKEDR